MSEEKKHHPKHGPNSFKAGDPNHPKTVNKRLRAGLMELPPLESPVPLVDDMQHVRSRNPSLDVTPSQKACRQWLREDPKDFLKHLSKLEAEAAPKVDPVAPADVKPAVQSERTRSILELIESTLEGANREANS